MKTNCKVLCKWSKEKIIVHFFYFSLLQVLFIYIRKLITDSFYSFVAPAV